MMRIITGISRGTRLLTRPGSDTRPTTEQAKEGIFSAIQFEVMGARVLDLFAGTGQLGLEALSRGAKSATFVDSARPAADLVSKNADRTHLSEHATVVCADVFSFLKKQTTPFSLIFADPPYSGELLPKVVEKILQYGVLADNGILVLEFSSSSSLPASVTEPFDSVRRYKYGKTHCAILRKGEEKPQ